MTFWQDNEFYKSWSKTQCESKIESKQKTCYDYKNLELIKLYPESEEDIYDAFNAPEGFGHRLDALKHCVDNEIPFLRWNGMIYDWHQNRIDK